MSRWGKQGKQGVQEEKDVLAAAEEAYRKKMTDPDTAGDWSKVTLNPAHVAAPATREDVTIRLAQLKVEEAAAMGALAQSQQKQRDILNAQLDEQRRVEQAAEDLSAVPAQLAETMETIRAYVGTADAPAAQPAGPDYAARGAEALSVAMRRSRGEVVEEPVYADVVPLAPGESPRQAQLRARVAPALEAAEARRQEITLWEKKIGPSLDHVHVRRGEEDAMVEMVNALMRGVPPTQPNISFVQSLIRTVTALVENKSVMAGTLSRETAAIAGLIARCDSRGPLEWQGDHSRAYYELERDLVGCLTRLATVTHESVAQLWTGAQGISERLKKLAEIRTKHAGTAVPKIIWESKAQIASDADKAAVMTARGTEHARPTRAITGSPYDQGEARR